MRWSALGAAVGVALLALLWMFQLLDKDMLSRRGAGVDADAVQAVLLVLACLWPILFAWKFIGYWLLGSGRYDTAYRASAFIGAAAGTAAAATWGGASGAIGLAFIAVGVELLVIVAQVAGGWLTRRRERA